MKSWRKIIALYFGLAGISTSASVSGFMILELARADLATQLVHIVLIILGILSVALSTYIWKGRRWSHTALIGVLLVGAVVLLILSVIDFLATTMSFASGVANISLYIAMLSLPAFLLAVLFHPDVIKEFKDNPHDQNKP